MENARDIADKAIHFFKNQFTEDPTTRDLTALRYLPLVVNDVDNTALEAFPTLDEVK